jgi:hypothetical protein
METAISELKRRMLTARINPPAIKILTLNAQTRS